MKSQRVTRWYLTEWEQYERQAYRRKRDAAFVAAGLAVGVAWSGWVIWWLGGW